MKPKIFEPTPESPKVRYVDADFDSSRGGHQVKPDVSQDCCATDPPTEAPRRLFTQEQLRGNEADARRALHRRVAEFMMLPNSENSRDVDQAIFAYQDAWMTGRRRVTVE